MNGSLSLIITTVLGSVLGSGAVFGFLEFIIKRKDEKEENTIDKKIEVVEKKIEEGLESRENTGKERFETHQKAIKKISEDHDNNFNKLIEAIEQLKDNDTKVAQALDNMSGKQGLIANGLLGLSHDRLIFLTDKIAARKYITLKEQSTIDSMYVPYKSLGGNGDVSKAYNYVMSLPVVSEEQAKKLDEDIESLRNGTYFSKE